MKGSAAERQQVYLACKGIFSGQKALIRQKKCVLKEIKLHEKALGSVKSQLGDENLLDITCDLLELRVFELDSVAGKAFPELFRSPSKQKPPQKVPEKETAISSKGALPVDVVTKAGNATVSENPDIKGKAPIKAAEVVPIITAPATGSTTIKKRAALIPPSLYPVFLPYTVQHYLLTKVQLLLEECCFNFAKQWIPDVLEKEKCDCAVAIELSRWTFIIQQYSPKEAFNQEGKEIGPQLSNVNKLRNVAVHREKLPVSEVQGLIASSVALASLLRDQKCAAVLRDVAAELNSKIDRLILIKKNAEKTAAAKLRETQRKRQELDAEEALIIVDMLKHDAENVSVIGALVEYSVGKIFRTPLEEDEGPDEAQDEAQDDWEDEDYYDIPEDFVDVATLRIVGAA